MAIWLSLLLTAVVLLYVKITFFKSRRERMLLKIPGPQYNWLFGNALTLFVKREDLYGTIEKLCSEFSQKSVLRFWIGPSPFVVIVKAKAAEDLLTSIKVLDKGNDYDLLKPWLGTGLLTSTGSKWHSRRKLLTPTFHFRILEDFLLVINEHANILVKDVLGEKQENQTFDVYPHVCRCALDIICETSMGIKLNAQMDDNANYVKTINKMGEIFLLRITNAPYRSDLIYNFTSYAKNQKKYLRTLHTFTKTVIDNRKRERAEVTKSSANDDEVLGIRQKLAFLDLLLESSENGKVIDDAGIQEEVDTFMFEGHDTTASGLAWVLYNLGNNPQLQEKVYGEIRDVVGDFTEDFITSEQLAKLKYLERFIKESMRLFPPVPFYLRNIKEDFTLDGFQIPANTTVVINARCIHTDDQQWTDPWTFDPDRFLPENSVNRSPFSYVPFSAGPRNCIGQKFAMMELKVVTAKIVQSFEINSIEKLKDIKMYGELVFRPVNGLLIKIKRRAT